MNVISSILPPGRSVLQNLRVISRERWEHLHGLDMPSYIIDVNVGIALDNTPVRILAVPLGGGPPQSRRAIALSGSKAGIHE